MPAEHDGGLAALAVGYCETYEQQRHFYLKVMCVRPSLQRQGVGRSLVSRVMDDLTSTGVARVYLLTTRGGKAEAFYARCGFYVSPKRILMARRLSE